MKLYIQVENEEEFFRTTSTGAFFPGACVYVNGKEATDRFQEE